MKLLDSLLPNTLQVIYTQLIEGNILVIETNSDVFYVKLFNLALNKYNDEPEYTGDLAGCIDHVSRI